MTQCIATTTKGDRCKKNAQKGKTTCFFHKDFVLGGQTQAKIVDFVQKAGRVYVTISEMKAKFCHARAQLSKEIKDKIDRKEERLDRYIKKLENLARKCGTQNVETKVDKLRVKFNKEKRDLFKLITTFCKRNVSPAYVVPEYPPTQEVMESIVARSDGKTEQKYVSMVATFFSIFMKWSVFGLTKTPSVIQWLAAHYIFTFFSVICLIIKFPQQVGKRIPVAREIIVFIETMIEIHEQNKRRAREFRETIEDFYRFIFAMVSRTLRMKITNPLRLISESIQRMREKGNLPPKLDQRKIDAAFKLWEQHTQLNLPMPDNVLLPPLDDPWWIHAGEGERLVAANYDTWPKLEQNEYVVMSVVGMVLYLFKRLWR